VGTLYLVATPIGNLEDVTLRALRVLREAELLLAEDTRRTRILLERHGIPARPVSLHAHNEAARCARVLEVLGAGSAVALVSDAGTPLVSDPGEKLVAAALAAGHRVEAVPGASAVLAALAVAGLPVERFAFAGFLPRKAGERDAWILAWRSRAETLVLFESPRRVAATLRRLAEILGDRPACVARELTKLHEEAARGGLCELAERFSTGARGEVTIVVGGCPAGAAPAAADLDTAIRAGLAGGEGTRELAARLAGEHGVARRQVYARALALRSAGRGDGKREG
jgi:16S rRNA (cytidine1402-2'-O)-methyltransferase